MGEIINLRRFRKAKERAEAQSRASVNRAQHGRTKAEREGETARETLAGRKLEGHRRETSKDPGDDEPAA